MRAILYSTIHRKTSPGARFLFMMCLSLCLLVAVPRNSHATSTFQLDQYFVGGAPAFQVLGGAQNELLFVGSALDSSGLWITGDVGASSAKLSFNLMFGIEVLTNGVPTDWGVMWFQGWDVDVHAADGAFDGASGWENEQYFITANNDVGIWNSTLSTLIANGFSGPLSFDAVGNSFAFNGTTQLSWLVVQPFGNAIDISLLERSTFAQIAHMPMPNPPPDTPIPEPSSLVLLGIGALVLGQRRRTD